MRNCFAHSARISLEYNAAIPGDDNSVSACIDQEFITSQYSATFINTMFGWPALPSYDMPSYDLPAYDLPQPSELPKRRWRSTATMPRLS